MSLFNLSVALRGLSTASITVRRPNNPGFDDNGMAVGPSFTTFSNVRSSAQNMHGGEMLRHVPEGDRAENWLKIWPEMQLVTGDRVDVPSKGTFIVQELDECVGEGGFTGAYIRKFGDGEA